MNEVWERCPNVLPLHLNSIGRCRGFYILNTTNTMEIIEHLQQGSLPDKMVNWPKNIEAAKALADRYDELAKIGGVDDQWQLRGLTGFGGFATCTLCVVVTKNEERQCTRCLHFNGIRGTIPCIVGESKPTYYKVKDFPTSENLRARASYIRSVINKFE